MYIYIYIYIYLCIHIRLCDNHAQQTRNVHLKDVCLYVYTYTYIYIYIHTYIFMHSHSPLRESCAANKQVWSHAHAYTHVYTCLHALIKRTSARIMRSKQEIIQPQRIAYQQHANHGSYRPENSSNHKPRILGNLVARRIHHDAAEMTVSV